jgi:hypothetical protein
MKHLTALIISITLLLSLTIMGQASERRKPTKTGTALKIGAGAGVGAVVGGLIGGKRGAAAGALIGGGGMAAHSMAKRDSGYGRTTRKTSTIIAGTAIGTGVGAAIGGGKGAGIGALVGGGASTLYAFTRKDLKKPKYDENYSRQPQLNRSQTRYEQGVTDNQNSAYQYQPGYNNPTSYSNVRYIDNNDPYQRVGGPQGAGIGRLCSGGSTSIY